MRRRAKGIHGRRVIERTGRETERREDSSIKRGRKCLVKLSWATTGGFSSQALWAIHRFSGARAPHCSMNSQRWVIVKQCSTPTKPDDKRHPSRRHKTQTNQTFYLSMTNAGNPVLWREARKPFPLIVGAKRLTLVQRAARSLNITMSENLEQKMKEKNNSNQRKRWFGKHLSNLF